MLGLQLYNDDALIDSFYTQFGFRTLATDGPRIKLNDQSVFFAGVARHEEWQNMAERLHGNELWMI
ncbi:hypothetical protein JCM19047_161 [Bacillus sp. JCM 19047]|nr:hypothetical protein JCM19047_161 [Bacillus sp. JCM 19047]